eukprot:447903_1
MRCIIKASNTAKNSASKAKQLARESQISNESVTCDVGKPKIMLQKGGKDGGECKHGSYVDWIRCTDDDVNFRTIPGHQSLSPHELRIVLRPRLLSIFNAFSIEWSRWFM